MLKCATCDAEHSLEDLEPTFKRPDDYFKLSDEQKQNWARADNDLCRIDDPNGGPSRYFVRTTMPFAVQAREMPIRWGLWAEVTEFDAREILNLWTDPEQSSHPPIASTLANQVPGYDPTIGMACELYLVDERTRPELRPAPGVENRFAREFRNGVSEETAIAWVHAFA